jgi:Zn-dependent peptidase ImmA (M78 family)
MYRETDLELWIYDIYQKHGIIHPSDLTLRNVAEAFNCEIIIWDKPTKAVWDDELGAIFLNEELRSETRREAFFHELGHPFLHVGNQLNMPKEFNDYQEEQANLFQLYASMPIYMIKQLELPRWEIQFIELLSWEFDVTIKLAQKRLNQIKRRIYQANSDKLFAAQLKLQMELLS